MPSGVSWLQRFRAHAPRTAPPRTEESTGGPSSLERTSPGLALLFEHLSPDGGHSILDLGTADSVGLRLLGRYARQIRFAGLVPPPRAADPGTLVDEIPAHPEHPYDVVLAWDVLDHLDGPLQVELARRIAEITAPEAWLYAVARSDGSDTVRPRRIEFLALDRVVEKPVGPLRPAGPELLPAQMEKLLEPFRVVRGISLRTGAREYVATKSERRH